MHSELREFGIGYVAGGYYLHYWTVDFGSQPDVLPVFINRDDGETETRQVTLTLTNEKVSGCSGIDYAQQVMLSNEPGFPGAQWQAYAPQKPWTLAEGNGQQFVYVKYRDASGYQATSNDEIQLNEPPRYHLQLGATSATFFYEIGAGFGTPVEAHIPVMNGASSLPMSWDATASWIGVDPQEGTTPDEMAISAAGFTADVPGTHQDVVAVTSPQDPENPQAVTVTVRVVEEIHYQMLPFIAHGYQD
jgi:hypothetical protein